MQLSKYLPRHLTVSALVGEHWLGAEEYQEWALIGVFGECALTALVSEPYLSNGGITKVFNSSFKFAMQTVVRVVRVVQCRAMVSCNGVVQAEQSAGGH